MKQFGLCFDQTRCTGCETCVVACKDWNDIPAGPAFWIRVATTEQGNFPNVLVSFMARACYHCAEPPCVPACPTGASYRRPDGIVLIDRDTCVGCGLCLEACPYSARHFDPASRKMGKCTSCAHLLERGERPACVKTCTTGASAFGDLNDPASDAPRVLRPSARFILRKQRWRGRG